MHVSSGASGGRKQLSSYDEIFMKHDKEKVAKLLKEDIINLKPFSEFFFFSCKCCQFVS
jgi:hypothetical protein